MKTKRVNRYYCDFCKKSGCSAYHMRRHEERCTMNPNRKCGMCDIVGEEQKDLTYLMDILPAPEWIEGELVDLVLETLRNESDIQAVIPDLRDAANGCPACMMAALRQKGIPVPMAMDYKKERDEFWGAYNEAQYVAEVESAYQYARWGGR